MLRKGETVKTFMIRDAVKMPFVSFKFSTTATKPEICRLK
jgi:hypothetical protein